MTDGGRINPDVNNSPRYQDPNIAAGTAFAKLLGVPATAVVSGTAPAGTPSAAPVGASDAPVAGIPSGPPAAGTQLGVVRSPPLVSIIEQLLSRSDNTVAELMARQVALASGQPASFAGESVAVRQELTKLGLPATGLTIVDGSGLSKQNRLTPRVLTAILTLAARSDQPDLHGLFTGLPVAGYSGTLAERFRTPAVNAADGEVRAKTGTLTGVNTLAGYVTDASGRLLVFAVMADRTEVGAEAAEEALDRIGTALAQVR
jgi:D-alanyl-D-alanine carboxypeptidase/D-alanyl-D-alanine-endopeptidase (penicillin-binding protein 4)